MSRNAFSKSQVFLMEFILVILFFALCGAICVKAFVQADTLSKESRRLNQGMLLVQSAVECVKASPNAQLPDLLSETMDMERVDEGLYRSYYDLEFRSCGAENAAYYLELTLSREDEVILHAEARVLWLQDEIGAANAVDDEAESICSLSADKYMPEGESIGAMIKEAGDDA